MKTSVPAKLVAFIGKDPIYRPLDKLKIPDDVILISEGRRVSAVAAEIPNGTCVDVVPCGGMGFVVEITSIIEH